MTFTSCCNVCHPDLSLKTSLRFGRLALVQIQQLCQPLISSQDQIFAHSHLAIWWLSLLMTLIWLSQSRVQKKSNRLETGLAQITLSWFTSSRWRSFLCHRDVDVPFTCSSNHPRVEEIKALGVTISRKFSLMQHVDCVLVSCAQSLFALHTLLHHGLPTYSFPGHSRR